MIHQSWGDDRGQSCIVLVDQVANGEEVTAYFAVDRRGHFGEVQVDLITFQIGLGGLDGSFSAAVADMMGGGGNMVEATHRHVDAKHAYLIICGGALILAFFPTLTILALASRAFAFYYLLQCLISIAVAKSKFQKLFFGAIAAALAFITLFAVPAG